ncbi:uncharacterized protein LOC132561188 [Ylistrum balloti]|uniref:uncharacterized protein LOC132561188 n=1 Tax=Ylistrum balloti TaxID=509963 RepID=UPI002905DD37|nr:uncharacterized protein LOC132561188 [Ylistrum balloti]
MQNDSLCTLSDQIQAAVGKSQNEILGHLDTLISQKLSSFERKMCENSEASLNKIQETIQCTDTYKFKKRSCEEQYKFNTKVRGKLLDAAQAVSTDMDTARLKIQEGMSLIDYRNKLIKLADSSEAGWKTVDEYVANPIASDSDDERKIDRASSKAVKKAKAEKLKSSRGRQRFNPYQRETFVSRSQTNAATTTDRTGPFPRGGTKPGTCFGCGKAGHWRQECPEIKGVASAVSGYKISGSLFDMHEKVSAKQDAGKVGATQDAPRVTCDTSPVGRLKGKSQYWADQGTIEVVQSIIERGYKIPFHEIPPRVSLSNNKTAKDNPDFVVGEITKLLRLGCVSEVSSEPAVINPLTVAFNQSGKPRLVLDCRHINPFLHKFKFKYDDARVARDVFQPGDFLFTFDLKSAYHHIEIFEEHRQFLGFEFEVEGKTRQFVFNVLPFGISTAGYVFTKVLREVVKSIRLLGHKLVMYLDDGIGGHETEGGANESSRYVRQALIDYGFLIAEEKSNWVASQHVTWLGYTWSMGEGVVRVTSGRVERLLYWLTNTMTHVKQKDLPLLSARYIAGIVGQVISMQGVVGHVARLRTRELYRCVLARASWNARVLLTSGALDEIQFWLSNVKALNDKGSQLKQHLVCDAILCTDASGEGYGGYVQYVDTSGRCEHVGVTQGVNGCTYIHDTNSIETGASKCYQGVIPQGDFVTVHGTDVFQHPQGACEVRPRIYLGHDHDGTKWGQTFEFLGQCNSTQGVRGSPRPGFCYGSSISPTGGLVGGPVSDVIGLQGSEVSVLDRSLPTVRDLYHMDKHVALGTWDEREKRYSSTWRELEAVKRVLLAKVDMVKGKQVKLLTDNRNVCSIVKTGSRKPDLQRVAREINEVLDYNNTGVSTQWLPRISNSTADYLSRCKDCDDWSVQSWVFEECQLLWGPHQIDRFATDYNSKCVRFNSKWWCPGTEAVDAFTVRWQGVNNWLVPPPRLVCGVVSKMRDEGAYGTIIVPHWRSAAYWHLLCPKDGAFDSFIVDYRILPSRKVTLRGRGNNGCFGASILGFDMLALRLDFRH